MAGFDFFFCVSLAIITELKKKHDEHSSDYNDSKSQICLSHCTEALKAIRDELSSGELDEKRLKELESISNFVSKLVYDVYLQSSIDSDFFKRFYVPEINNLYDEIVQLLNNKKNSQKKFIGNL